MPRIPFDPLLPAARRASLPRLPAHFCPQVDEALERVVALFSYIADKDVFGDAFRRDLAKRLLNQRTVGAEAERGMVLKLKLRCGAQYTSKMVRRARLLDAGSTVLLLHCPPALQAD